MAWIAVPTLAFLEACPGIGFFISGIILLTICSLLHAQDIVPLSIILPSAFAGACIADHLGYYLGKWLGPKVHRTEFVKKRVDKIKKVERFIQKYGGYSVLLGRLIPSVRSVTPMLIGASGVERTRFTILDILACTIWTAGLAILVLGIENFLA